MTERSPVRERTEFREKKLELVRTERILIIVQRLALAKGATSEVAALVMQQLATASPDSTVTIDLSTTDHTAEVVQALRYEIEYERLQYGDETIPERQEFLEKRQPIQEATRQLRRRLHYEYAVTTEEALSETEQNESALFGEINGVVQDVATAMQFQRPVQLELSRERKLNAYVLVVEKLGDHYDVPTTEPIHVFVNIGLITELGRLFQAQGKVFSKDHLAAIIGHELRHLQQKQYQPDEGESSQSTEARVRYEYDADLAGMEASDLAGYNPEAAIEVQQALLSSGPTWAEVIQHYFSKTHPVTQNRVTALAEEYHRPERVFYNADQPLQSFSPAALENASEIAREKLLMQLNKARTVQDWDILLEDLMDSRKATLRDYLMALDTLRLQLDVQTALATAEDALEQDRFGLRTAILYEANAVVAGEQTHCSLIQQRQLDRSYNVGPTTDESKDYRGQVLRDLLTYGRRERADRLFDPTSVKTEQLQKAVEFHRQHVVLVPVETLPVRMFATLDDLFNPDNPAALKYWGIPDGWVKKPEVVGRLRTARAKLMEHLTNRILRGFEFKYALRGKQDTTLKEAVLKVFAEAKPTVVEPDITTAAFPKFLAELAALAQARVSQSIATSASIVERQSGETTEPEPEINFRERYHPFVHTAELGDTGFGRVYRRIMNRLHDLWSAAIASKQLTALPPDIAEDLFRRLTADTVFPHLAQKFIPTSLETLQPWGTTVPAVLRAIPLFGETQRDQHLPFARHDRADYEYRFDKPAHDVRELMVGAIGQDMHTASIGDLGDVMQRVSELNNHPYVQQLFQRGPDRWQPDPALAALAPAAWQAPPFYKPAARPHLFTRWIREGLQANVSEPNAPAWLHELEAILVGHAEVLGLPPDYFVGALDQLPKDQPPQPLMKRLLLSVLEVVAKKTMAEARAKDADHRASWQTQIIGELTGELNRIATELYAASGAQDMAELKTMLQIDLDLYEGNK
ncbi:MAG: hypothetical protein HY565_05180 [Candidatus Kerfeldbacteria bacterium]|nr:hypothetical protein [Candidatus Kerfeldbacteria bacterium]